MIDSLIGQRYRIKALIGEGGMASVYSALDEKLERRVAIKILHPHLARNVDIRERFLLEAKTVSGLDHPNILRVYDFSGLESDQLWMVTEILYGEDLSDYVKAFPKHRMQFIVATLITREICRALHEAHKLNIVHRDIKPENIMMLTNGQLKLMDFGIAKVSRANATQTGIFMGSPSYMSPEQIRGTDVDYRADIYSLSVLFYEIVTGTLPFVGKTTAEVINRIMVGRYTPPNMLITDLPFGLNQVIVKGMQGHKEERYQSITEMAQALDSFLQSCNFRESRTELEEFATDRAKFELRLSQLVSPKPGRVPSNVPLAPEEKSPTFRSQVTRFHASYEGLGDDQGDDKSAEVLDPLSPTGPDHVPQNSTMILDESMAINLPSKEGGPVSMKLTLPDQSSGEIRAASEDIDLLKPEPIKPPKRSEADAIRATISPQEMKIRTQTIAPGRIPKQPMGSGDFQSPLRASTQPPRTPQSNSKSRSTQQRAYYREFAEDEKKKKKTNLIFIGIGILAVAAVLFFFVFDGDRMLKGTNSKTSRPIAGETSVRPPKRPRVETPAPELPLPAPTTQVEPIAEVPVESPSPAPEQPVVVAPTKKPKLPAVVVAPTVKQPLFKPNTPVKPDAPSGSPGPGTAPPKKPDPVTVLASIPVEKPEDKIPEVIKQPEESSSKESGVLRLSALPAAEVYIDGKMYGTTNDKQIGSQGLKLDPGTYKLRLKRPGYKVDEQVIQIKAGKKREINVTLTKIAESLVELSVKVNKIPATVVVEENKEGGRKIERLMTKHSTQINLKPGSYKITVSHEQQTIPRTMEVTEENKSITFNADFK